MRRPSARVVGLTVVLLLAVTTAVTVGSAELGPLPAGAAVEPPGLIVQRDHLTGLDHPWDVGFLPDGTMFV
ncbi:MAG: PQQ-dependent sugar dehydrogenase, partial [Acidimicrobiia bacterium]